MRKNGPTRLALSLIIFLASSPVWGSEATDLAALVVAAYGGSEAIERSSSVKQTGKLDSYRHGKTGTVERTFSRPNRLRVEIRIPGEPPESRILNGALGWRNGQEVPPMMAKAMVLQAARLDLPYLIMKAGQDIKLVGTIEDEGNHNLTSLELPMADGLRLIAVVDRQTGYIVSSHGLIALDPSHGMEFATYYSKHERMDGIVFAAEETHFAQGQATGKTVLSTSEVVQELPDAVFRP